MEDGAQGYSFRITKIKTNHFVDFIPVALHWIRGIGKKEGNRIVDAEVLVMEKPSKSKLGSAKSLINPDS